MQSMACGQLPPSQLAGFACRVQEKLLMNARLSACIMLCRRWWAPSPRTFSAALLLCCSCTTAAFNQEDAEHPVWDIKDKYREDRWQAVGLQVPLGTCQPGWSLPVSDE